MYRAHRVYDRSHIRRVKRTLHVVTMKLLAEDWQAGCRY